jgi:type IV secretory pathway TraG/TraD family ATPase VirD4
MAIAIILSVWRAKEAQHVTTYGSARWADKREVRRAGLLGPDGVVLGRLSGATSAITVQNTSCALRLLALARASVLLSQPS